MLMSFRDLRLTMPLVSRRRPFLITWGVTTTIRQAKAVVV